MSERLSDKEKERYSRHLILEGFGEEAQLKLKSARLLVIGAGGLGCPALLYLSAAGIGSIGIMDGDVVNESNLQRQVLFSNQDIGRKKSEVAKEKLSQQNPFISFETYTENITKENALQIIRNYDVVVDASDNFATRYLINDACVILNKPFIYGAIYKYQGQVSVFNYDKGPTYRCLFPSPPETGEVPGCGETGVIGILPGVIGTMQANEAIKIITGIGEPLTGRLFTINLLTMETDYFEFEAEERNQAITQLGNYDSECRLNSIHINELNKLKKTQTVQIIDVREKAEYELKNLNGINIPLTLLKEKLNEINPDILTVVHCKSGIRSQKAIEIILKNYPAIEIYNLTGYDL